MNRHNLVNIIIILAAIIASVNSYGVVNTSTAIFDRNVRTLKVTNPDNFMAPAVIRLGTSDRIFINFDIIGDSHDYLRYKLIHCNADWQPSRLLESEYVDGFNEAELTDYAYSSNTFVHYVNYNIEIPNPDLRIMESGNYVLQVYPEGQPEELLLQARFSVTENSMPAAGSVTTRTDMGVNTEYQQLSIAIDAAGGRYNPYQDFVVTVMQNNRPETMRTLQHPLRVDGSTIIFEHDPTLVYPAGDEYRRFETVRADYAGMHVDSVKFGGSNWHAWLTPDTPRAGRDYSYDRTQHGRFMIDEYNSTDPDLGADYITVHFTLDSPEIVGGDVYISGDLTLNNLSDSNRMRYDYNTKLYTAEIPLKQGSYNYQYVVVPHRGGYPDPSPIDGNKYETNNEYLVQVFLRLPGSRADRLVGCTVL
ncbi:MAG: DUF5103 domain-containing protein [Bacteroides sp.]|nr:DUF5103 domain-containing protein [Bacteroides sp.]MBD5358734.1 DUF5103 domain-containing protein [Bacteroides sp.]